MSHEDMFANARFPQGEGGKAALSHMNEAHDEGTRWALESLEISDDSRVLDIGCGGGLAMSLLRQKFNGGVVAGVDYSPTAVEETTKFNESAVERGECTVTEGSVSELPFEGNHFDLVTAFETVYFWPKLTQDFGELLRVLRPGGKFLIFNATDGLTKEHESWAEQIEGMRIYTADELSSMLREAGFEDPVVDTCEGKSWIRIVARKP